MQPMQNQPGGKKRGIPDRWLEYEAMGRQVPGTRFIAFKVPLKQVLVNKLGDGAWFTPRTLMDHCTTLGLVVDLTNTTRYYDPEVFSNHDIQYAKVFTEGHKIPNDKAVYQFFGAVNKFLEVNKDNEKLVGVHCTHGLNRSGYMVCRYMIQQLGIPPDQAITDYNSARGHEQERENYLEDLRKAKWLKDPIPDPDDPEPAPASKRARNDGAESDDQGSTPRSGPMVRRWGSTPELGRGEYRPWAPWQSDSPNGVHQRNSPRPEHRHSRGRDDRSHPYQGPHGARRYYDQRYHGRVAPQYDTYFYQDRGSGVGPHRPAPHWTRQQDSAPEGPRGPPRQYRGPRQYQGQSHRVDYNSPLRDVDGVPFDDPSYRTPRLEGTPHNGQGMRTPLLERTPLIERTPLLPRTPRLEGTPRMEMTPLIERTPLLPRTPRLEGTPRMEMTPRMEGARDTPSWRTPNLDGPRRMEGARDTSSWRTPNLDVPRRNVTSPGANDVTPRRRSSRWNPY